MTTNTELNTAVCAVLGTTHPRHEMYGTFDGRLICGEEFVENWFACDATGLIHPASEMVIVGRTGERVSRQHASEYRFRFCHYYEVLMPRDDGITTQDIGWVSEEAYDNGHVGQCVECEGWYSMNSLDEQHICPNCQQNRGGRGRLISDYSCRDYPSPRGKGPRFYGVELEVEVIRGSREDAACAVHNLVDDFAILKDDGSLNNGFEIVTCPATFDEQSKGWRNFFERLPSTVRSWNTETCGMHIHVSRDALSSLQLGKMLVFVNMPQHTEFVVKMAGRSSDRWAGFSPKKLSDGMKPSGDRYKAINVSGVSTIEFRIFRGTLNRDRFFANLEFVHALVDFTDSAARSIHDSTNLNCFIAFAQKHRKAYPHLFAKLVTHGYASAPKTKPGIVVAPVAAKSNI